MPVPLQKSLPTIEAIRCLMGMGYDTMFIAHRFCVQESVIYNILARSK